MEKNKRLFLITGIIMLIVWTGLWIIPRLQNSGTIECFFILLPVQVSIFTLIFIFTLKIVKFDYSLFVQLVLFAFIYIRFTVHISMIGFHFFFFGESPSLLIASFQFITPFIIIILSFLFHWFYSSLAKSELNIGLKIKESLSFIFFILCVLMHITVAISVYVVKLSGYAFYYGD